MKKIIATAIISLMIQTINAQSQSFDAVVSQMLVYNPAIKELNHGAEAEIQEMKAENILEGPELEGFHKWGNSGDRKYGAGISQGFDWPGLYSARRQMIRNNESALGLLRNATITDKKVEARSLLIDLVNSKRNISILERIDTMMIDLAKFYDAAYRSGQVSILDKNKIDIEIIRLGGRLTEENNRYGDILASIYDFCGSDQIESELNHLNNYPDAMLLSAEDYKKLAEESDPYMAYLKQIAEVNKSRGKVESRSALPSFSLGYEWEREEGQDFNGFNIGIKFASWSNKNRRAAVVASVLENDVKISAQSKKLMTDIDNDHSTALDLIKQINKFENALNGNHHELLLKALKGGQINMLDYIQEVNFYLEAELDLENMRHQYQLALSRLNRLN
ncbi:MAG: TolC family protein [Muribaculaceae bacterium]|nr:TolC family protein [Muribaculaceae bacterium]